MTKETMVVPIKFGALNLQRGSEVGVISAGFKPRGPHTQSTPASKHLNLNTELNCREANEGERKRD